MTYTIHFDGACEYNPATRLRNPGGIATYGWTIYDGSRRVAYGYGEAGRGNGASNNVAEYTALISALEAAQALALAGPVEIRGDSQLVVNQVNGIWKINKPHLRTLRAQAQRLLGQLSKTSLCWVPREQNEEADELSKKAYRLALAMPAGEPWSKRLATSQAPAGGNIT